MRWNSNTLSRVTFFGGVGGISLALLLIGRADASFAVVIAAASSAAIASSLSRRAATYSAALRMRTALRRHVQLKRDILRPLAVEINTLRDRLERAVTAGVRLESALAGARAASDSKSSFLAGVSHDIRTPMTAILGFSEYVLEHEVSRDELCEAMRTIRRNGEHMLQLINDILDLSKVEAGKLTCERIAVAPRELIDDALKLWQPAAERKGLRLESFIAEDVPQWILSDPTRLRQIINNLLGNAIKFTATGTVTIDARLATQPGDDSGMLRVAIRDTGPGIRAADMNRIFSPYAQATAATARKHGGTGLGLCISRQLCEALGGSLDVQSTLGAGSEFIATIESGNAADIRAAGGLTRKALASAQPTVSGRILLVEDGPDNQRLIRFVLLKAGAIVDTADDGRVAVRKALDAWRDGHPYDVILMDMQMPVMDGFEATDELRRAGYCGPIIALTAFAMANDRKKCIDAGCDEFATKPIQRGELLETLFKYMPGGSVASPAVTGQAAPSAASE